MTETHVPTMEMQPQQTGEQEYQIAKEEGTPTCRPEAGRVQAHGLTALTTENYPNSACASGSNACVTSWGSYQEVKDEA